jgi:hypothetical protein
MTSPRGNATQTPVPNTTSEAPAKKAVAAAALANAPLVGRRKSDWKQYSELRLVAQAAHQHACQHWSTLEGEQGRTDQRGRQKSILSGEEIPKGIWRCQHQSDRRPLPHDKIDDDDAAK